MCAAILYFMFITPFLVVVVMQQLPDMINKDEGLFSSLNEIVQNDTVTTVVTFSVGGAEQKSNQDTVNIQNEQDNANNIDIKFNDAAVLTLQIQLLFHYLYLRLFAYFQVYHTKFIFADCGVKNQ